MSASDLPIEREDKLSLHRRYILLIDIDTVFA